VNPKVTIGIPFKDPGEYFSLALKSIFAQTFTDWELILVDDGSTDNSLFLAKNLQDPRVRVYSDGESRGLHIRLNQLVSLAKAPYFIRMDADDIMHPERLEKQYEELIRHSINTVVGSAAYSIDKDSKVTGFRQIVFKQKIGFSARHSFIHPTVGASVEWFRKNPYSEQFVFQRSQDAELWCRTTSSTKFINLPEPLLYYRESGTFSFPNYLGTSLGLLLLIHKQHSYPRHNYLVLFTRELLKLWVACILHSFGLSDYLVSRRCSKLNTTRLHAGNQALAIVRQQKLPIG